MALKCLHSKGFISRKSPIGVATVGVFHDPLNGKPLSIVQSRRRLWGFESRLRVEYDAGHAANRWRRTAIRAGSALALRRDFGLGFTGTRTCGLAD